MKIHFGHFFRAYPTYVSNQHINRGTHAEIRGHFSDVVFLFQFLFTHSIQESIDTMDMTEILQKREAIP